MKRTEPAETSPYEAALHRVRQLRSEQSNTPSPSRHGWVHRMRERVDHIQLKLILPPFARPGPRVKTAFTTRQDVTLWVALPLLIAAVALLIYRNAPWEDLPLPASVVSIPSNATTAPVQTYTFPLARGDGPLVEGLAITKAAECLARAGYDIQDWQSEDVQPVAGISSLPLTAFQRVDENSGYIVFENKRKPSHRITVTLIQSGFSLKVIVSDSAR